MVQNVSSSPKARQWEPRDLCIYWCNAEDELKDKQDCLCFDSYVACSQTSLDFSMNTF